MDDPTTATPEVVAETVTAPTAPPVISQPADPRRIARTVEIVRDDPQGQRLLAEPLGLMTQAQFDERLQAKLCEEARTAAIEDYNIPAERQKFIVGTTSAEVRQSAREIADMLGIAATPATTATQPTAEPAVNQPLTVAPVVAAPQKIENKEDAVAAYAALGVKVG